MKDEECPYCGKYTYDFHYGRFEPEHRFGGSEPDEGYCRFCGFHYTEHIKDPLEEQVKRYKEAKKERI